MRCRFTTAKSLPCARRAEGVDGVRCGLGCNDQRAGLRSAFANAHARPWSWSGWRGVRPLRRGREVAILVVDNPRDPTALARTRELMTLRNVSAMIDSER